MYSCLKYFGLLSFKFSDPPTPCIIPVLVRSFILFYLLEQIKIYSEDDFLARIQKSNPSNEPIDLLEKRAAADSNKWASVNIQAGGSVGITGTAAGTAGRYGGGGSSGGSIGPSVSSSSAKSSSLASKAYSAHTKTASSSSSGSSSSSQLDSGAVSEADLLWVDKHKPKRIADIIGNGDIARKLVEWVGRRLVLALCKLSSLPLHTLYPHHYPLFI